MCLVQINHRQKRTKTVATRPVLRSQSGHIVLVDPAGSLQRSPDSYLDWGKEREEEEGWGKGVEKREKRGMPHLQRLDPPVNLGSILESYSMPKSCLSDCL